MATTTTAPAVSAVQRRTASSLLRHQQDEVEALESIYELDPFTKVSITVNRAPETATRQVLAVLHIELGEDMLLHLVKQNEDDSESGSEDGSENGGESSSQSDPSAAAPKTARAVVVSKGSFVRVVTSLRLSPTYPETTPPETATLEPAWFTNALGLDSIPVEVNRLWEAEGRQPIVFQWLQSLRDRVGSLPQHHLVDVDWDEPELQMYLGQVHETTRELRRLAVQTCVVCMDEIDGRRAVFLLNCNHVMCDDCLTNMVTHMLANSQVLHLRCPVVGCPELLHPHDIKTHTDQASYDKYEKLMLDRTLDTMRDVGWCPRVRCGSVAMTDWTTYYGHCPKCLFDFCLRCHETWHPGDCPDSTTSADTDPQPLRKPNAQHAAPNNREGGPLVFKGNLNEPSRAALLDYGRQALAEISRASVDVKGAHLGTEGTKRCPHCYVAIEKNGGCHHMYCINCQTPFSWENARPLLSVRKYRAMDTHLVAKLAEQKHEKLKVSISFAQIPCPTCRLLVPKVGGLNHLQCFACLTKFCFLCGGIVRKTNQHFSVTGPCQQHSQDVVPRRYIAGLVARPHAQSPPSAPTS